MPKLYKIDWRHLAKKDNFARLVKLFLVETDTEYKFRVSFDFRHYDRETDQRRMYDYGDSPVIESPLLRCFEGVTTVPCCDDTESFSMTLTEEACENEQEVAEFFDFMQNVFDRYFVEQIQVKQRKNGVSDTSILPSVKTLNGMRSMCVKVMPKDFYVADWETKRFLSFEDCGIAKSGEKFVKAVICIDCIVFAKESNRFCVTPWTDLVALDFKGCYTKRLVYRRVLKFAMDFASLLLPVYVFLEIFDWLECCLTVSNAITREWVENMYRKLKVDVIQRVLTFFRAFQNKK